jgi:hypothetical protein
MRKLLTAGLALAAGVGASSITFEAANAQPVVVERYGHWDDTWGRAPPPPLRRWHNWRGHETNWYGHVHNCMVRYHGYDARRDMYREGRRWVACRD